MKFFRVVDIIGCVLQLLYVLLDVHHLAHLIDEVDIDKLIKNSYEISINDDTSTNGTSKTAFDSINLKFIYSMEIRRSCHWCVLGVAFGVSTFSHP
jgi:hypothetical protein